MLQLHEKELQALALQSAVLDLAIGENKKSSQNTQREIQEMKLEEQAKQNAEIARLQNLLKKPD